MSRNGRFIETARRFLARAEKELVAGRASSDEIELRQAAEKGWGAVTEATKALFVSKGIKIPLGTTTKEDRLEELQQRDPEMQNGSVADKFSRFLLRLHAEAWGDGDVSVKRLERQLRDVGKYIGTIERLARRRP